MSNDERRKFSKWVRDSREELKLTEQELAERLEVSIPTLLMWEVGNTDWAVIPEEYKRKFQELFGQYPHVDVVEVTTDYRDGAGTAFADDIEEEVLRILEDERRKSRNNSADVTPFQPILKVDCVEAICGCSAQIWGSDEGRCPNCKKRMDGSQ